MANDAILSYTRNHATEEHRTNRDRMLDLLCELNVARSLQNICHTTIVQDAWARRQRLSIHGWCYRLTDGLIR
jgi:carbonic anhydrase